MAIDKVVLPGNLQDETPVEGAKDLEEMIIILARKNLMKTLQRKMPTNYSVILSRNTINLLQVTALIEGKRNLHLS